MTHSGKAIVKLAGIIAAAVLSFYTGNAVADDEQQAGGLSVISSSTDNTFIAQDKVSLAELDESRGKDNTVVYNFNSTSEEASVDNNVAIGNITGTNTVSNAFNSSSGFVNNVINSGNNVAIQTSTIVSVTLK